MTKQDDTLADPMADQPVADHPMAAARPEAPGGVVRRLALDGVLSAVLGDRPRPSIGRYVLDRKVGAGGMGVVYRATAPDGAVVAIKLLDGGAGNQRARFEREARLLRTIEHPNVVRYLEHGVSVDGLDYLVMEWLEGGDLGARLHDGPLAIREALQLALAAARGLAAVHRAGIVHRDVKPSNLFLAGDSIDDVRIVDFGVSRTLGSGTRLTATGAVVGTPHYMAPEQLHGTSDVRTDVYGLGATLFECLTGRLPYLGEHPARVLAAILAEPVPSVAALRPDTAPAIDALVARMLAKHPADRPKDMDAVVTQVADLLTAGARPPVVLSRLERNTPRVAVPAGPRCADTLIGRARETAVARGAISASLDDEEASLVVVSGDSGVGKSALLAATEAWARRLAEDVFVVSARARRDETGAPFALVSRVADALASARTSLGAVAGRFRAHVADASEGVGDPLLVADRLALAWLDLLEAAGAGGPWVLLVDDAHAADLSSLRLLDRALGFLGDRPFSLLVTTESEGAIATLGAGFDAQRASRVPLGPLRAGAAARLAALAAPSASEAELSRLVAIAGANPAQLLACAREHALRGGVEPGSFADLTLSRMRRLDVEARRALRAASIVGREFDRRPVAHLLGVAEEAPSLTRHLEEAVAQGLLARMIDGDGGLMFANELAYLEAYALNTDDDLVRGHRAMFELEDGRSAASPLTLARHLRGAGERAAAAPHYVALARAALAGGDRALFDEHVAHAREGDPPDEILGALFALEAQAHFWRGELRAALEAGVAARALIAGGTGPWFVAMGQVITCAGQLGDDDAVERFAEEVLDTETDTGTDEDARAARFVALSRARSQLYMRQDCAQISAALARLGADATTAEARAWACRAKATLVASHLDATIDCFLGAHLAHTEHGDWRSATQLGLFTSSLYVWSGAWERARETLDETMRLARRLGADYLETWGLYVEGKLCVEVGTPDESRRILSDVAARTATSPRMQTGALVYASLAALRAGDLTLAEARAREALGPTAAPSFAAQAHAALARVLVASGQHAEARWLYDALRGPATDSARLTELDELVRLAFAELALALGEPEVGRAALERATSAIAVRASTLVDPLRRNHYLARPHLVAATLRLARAHGLAPV